jgi:TRAP-type C4-dicarboxylate transport system substrate-binding protein
MKYGLLTTAVAALMALGSYAQAQNLKMSHVRPQDATIDVELRAFSAALSEATGGNVNVKLFPASALGDYTTVQERISVGAIDMATQPAAAAADRRMQISSFPYLAGNWAQARVVYGPGGVVRDAMTGL